MFYIFPRIVKPEVCDKIVKDCLAENLESAKVFGRSPNSSRDDPSIRKTSVYFVPTDRDNKANELAWYFLKEANKQMFNYDLTYFQSIQFAAYKNGDFYDWHIDSYYQDEPNKTRKLSLSFMLTDPDDFEGGEFQFFNGGRPFQENGDATGEQIEKDLKAKGSIVVFDSRDFHRVCPVTDGVRYSIVCWATGAAFK